MRLFIAFSLFTPTLRSRLYSSHVSEDVVREFGLQWPDTLSTGRSSINVREPVDSPRLKEMFAFLEEKAGKVPHWDKFDSVINDPARFQVRGFREFDDDEIERSEYCVAVPLERVVVVAEELQGRALRVKRADILRNPLGGNSWRSAEILCTESTRRLLERESFANLAFRGVEVTGKKPPLEPIFLLAGERNLPPVLNELLNQHGDPVSIEDPSLWQDGEFTGTRDQLRALGCWASDFYYPPVLRFEKAAVERDVGEFDVAPTSEGWNGGPMSSRQPYLVCSRRFREFCMKQRWKLEWWPVELVD